MPQYDHEKFSTDCLVTARIGNAPAEEDRREIKRSVKRRFPLAETRDLTTGMWHGMDAREPDTIFGVYVNFNNDRADAVELVRLSHDVNPHTINKRGNSIELIPNDTECNIDGNTILGCARQSNCAVAQAIETSTTMTEEQVESLAPKQHEEEHFDFIMTDVQKLGPKVFRISVPSLGSTISTYDALAEEVELHDWIEKAYALSSIT